MDADVEIRVNLAAVKAAPRLAEALGFGLPQLNGRPCFEVAAHAQRAVAYMNARPRFFTFLCGRGGRAAYFEEMAFLRALARACQKHPRAVVRI